MIRKLSPEKKKTGFFLSCSAGCVSRFVARPMNTVGRSGIHCGCMYIHTFIYVYNTVLYIYTGSAKKMYIHFNERKLYVV